MRSTLVFSIGIFAVAVGIALFGGLTPLRAEEPGLAARVATLEEQVGAIRKRLELLEARSGVQRTDVSDAADKIEDFNNLRNLVGLVTILGKLPMKDGALDVYVFVQRGDILPRDFSMFRSARLRKGPTDEEILRGDYTNFPWERCKADAPRLTSLQPFPLLWEKEPGPDGKHVVGLSNGAIRLLAPEELTPLLQLKR